MLTTMLVALGALLLAVVGCAVLNPGPPPDDTRQTDYPDSPIDGARDAVRRALARLQAVAKALEAAQEAALESLGDGEHDALPAF